MASLGEEQLGAAVEERQRLATTVSDHLALALANLRLRESLHDLSVRDPLTGLYNRRFMEDSLRREGRRADRHELSLGIVMLDVDHFKRLNDHHGHETGDQVLREIGAFLRQHVRGHDIACRYGGEEFLLILPDLSLDDTVRRAEEIRKAIGTDLRVLSAGHQHSVTVSAGVASYPLHGDSVMRALGAADGALLAAKAAGRDRVVVAEPARPSGDLGIRHA
jgi:diguanylate cyclase (GGDEF)-like protein